MAASFSRICVAHGSSQMSRASSTPSRCEDRPGKSPPTIGVDRPLYRPLCLFHRLLCDFTAAARTPIYRPCSLSYRHLSIDP